MTAHPYHRHLARALERMGAVYTVSDILAAIAEGRMQSFTDGDSWAITQVVDYPRARMLDVLVAWAISRRVVVCMIAFYNTRATMTFPWCKPMVGAVGSMTP